MMLLDCHFCESESTMEYTEGRQTSWTGELLGNDQHTEKVLVMTCLECGVQEVCEADDMMGLFVQIMRSKNPRYGWTEALIDALKIVWGEIHMKEMRE